MKQIPLRNKAGEAIAWTLVDDGDYETLNQWRWSLAAGREYAGRGTKENGKNRTVLMHRQILGLSHGDGRLVDHINRDALDNRRENLRLADRAVNAQNCSPRMGTKSQFRGVTYAEGMRSTPWRVRVKAGGRSIHVGYFATEDEAGEAAAAARAEYLPFSQECPKRHPVGHPEEAERSAA